MDQPRSVALQAPGKGVSLGRLLRAPVFPAALRIRKADPELEERLERGHDVLAGRVDLAKLRPVDAERYLQGLDVMECRGLALLRVLAVRVRYGQRNPWRLSPQARARRRLPDSPVGRRQRAWLAKLAGAGLLNR
jgi:hypothetical protein